MNKQEFESTVIPLIKQCSQIITQKRDSIQINTKPDKSFVTNLDVELEELIANQFKFKFPYLQIIGEELNKYNPNQDNEFKLYIDPIDGTEDFINLGNNNSISLGITQNNSPVFGAVYNISQKVLYLNEKQIEIQNSDILYQGKILIQGNPKNKSLFENYFGKENVEFVKGHSIALGITRAASQNARAYIGTSFRCNSWDAAGGLGICSNLENILTNNININSPQKTGIRIYQNSDLEMIKFLSKNKLKR